MQYIYIQYCFYPRELTNTLNTNRLGGDYMLFDLPIHVD